MRKRGAVLLSLIVGGVLLAWAGPAAAQDCGDWYRPVVCTAELTVTDSNYDRARLGDRADIRLAPREQITLELEARDQRGSRFPAERLVLQYDAYRCGSMLRVDDEGEGRLRVTATAAEGRCTLELWLPNNLNFAWEIDFEINVSARIGYERREAEVIANALYAALLNREPDPGGFSSAVAEIQSGNLEVQVNSMVRSGEFRQVINGMTPTQILDQFYQGILQRAGDSAGVRLYLGEMRRGEYTSVLLKLIRSPEFERRLQN
ncbi:MAG: DUF4214 domain-containing protein [Acidobacteriota bacterium]|jgi:hypothetical protein